MAEKIKWHRNGLGVFFVFYSGGVEVHVARGVDDEPRVVADAVGLPARERHRPAGEAQRRRQHGGRRAHDEPRCPGVGGRRVRPVVADRVGCGLLLSGVEVEP